MTTKENNVTTTTQPSLTRRNTLLERNEMARWINDIFMNKMDKYAFARGLILFCFLAFFLGNNLPIFLWLYSGIAIYLIIYRAVRFWVKRWLMYLIEFCYFGNFIFIFFITLFGQNRDIFSIAYVCSTGVMTLAVIIFNNQAQFSSTDHLTSSYIHTLPLISAWAIRWKHKIYDKDYTTGSGLNLLTIGDINFEFDNNLYKMIYLPIIFWICWAVPYFILTSTILKGYVISEKYGSGIGDFVHSRPLKFLFGDHKNNRQFKYILQHFIFFTVAIPLAILCFYNFIINTIYLVLIIIFLGWNTGRNNLRHIEKKLVKIENEILVGKNEAKVYNETTIKEEKSS